MAPTCPPPVMRHEACSMIENFPILSLVILLPLAGGIAVGLIQDINIAKRVALTIAGIELAATLVMVDWFDASSGNSFQLIEQHTWIPSLNILFLIGIDGISVLFL